MFYNYSHNLGNEHNGTTYAILFLCGKLNFQPKAQSTSQSDFPWDSDSKAQGDPTANGKINSTGPLQRRNQLGLLSSFFNLAIINALKNENVKELYIHIHLTIPLSQLNF